MQHNGRVVNLGRRCCFVDIGDRVIEVALKGTIVKKSRMYVGDAVTVEIPPDAATGASVVAVQPRLSLLHRPAIANIDLILFVNTLREPPLDLTVIDRCLFTASALRIRSAIVFNKCDLLDAHGRKELHHIVALYRGLGHAVVCASAATGEGIDAIVALCAGVISSLAGISGVGKSRILSRIFPDRNFLTGDISSYTERGKHTTTATTLMRLPGGGYIADTPGFSLIDLPLIDELDVINHFPDLMPAIGKCRFNNCIHAHEPGCKVMDLVDRGAIAESRYESYRRIFDEMKEKRTALYK